MAEDAAQRIARYVASELVRRGWTQAELAQAAGVNKNTITSFMRGEASPRTVKKVEAGLGMTPGTLAAAGEDTPDAGPSPALAGASPEDLLAALTHKVLGLREENARLQERVEHLEARAASAPAPSSPSPLHPVPAGFEPIAARTVSRPFDADKVAQLQKQFGVSYEEAREMWASWKEQDIEAAIQQRREQADQEGDG